MTLGNQFFLDQEKKLLKNVKISQISTKNTLPPLMRESFLFSKNNQQKKKQINILLLIIDKKIYTKSCKHIE